MEDIWDLFSTTKVIVDNFFKSKTPGIYIDIELQVDSRYGGKDHLKCKISLYEKRYPANHLFAITRFTIYCEDDTKLFEEYLNGVLSAWGAKIIANACSNSE